MGCFLFAVFCLEKPHVLFSPSCSFYPAFFLIMVCVRALLSCGLFCLCPLLSVFLRKSAGFLAQGSSHLCAKAWASLRKSVAVLAQGLRSLCAGPCVMRCHPCGRGGMPAAPCRGDSGVPRCRPCGCGAVAAVPWRGFPPAVSRPRAVSAGELLPAVRDCLCVLFRSSGKNAVA